MASRSKDGEIIALWLARNGYVAARGSTTRGGGTALMEMLVEMRTGRPGALTVDGPKGPPRVVQPGILRLVRETGAWILPISGASSRPRFLQSWDRFLVPGPFSRNVVTYGEPFDLPASMSDEEASRRLAEALDAATRAADEAVGVVPPPPGRPEEESRDARSHRPSRFAARRGEGRGFGTVRRRRAACRSASSRPATSTTCGFRTSRRRRSWFGPPGGPQTSATGRASSAATAPR
jgi:hypothetical protein